MEYDKKNAQMDHDILAEIDPFEQHINQLFRYAKGKKRSEEICDYIKAVNSESGNDGKWLEKEYLALRKCGSWILMRDYFVEKPKMIAGCTCKKHLLCGLCAIRRTGKCLALYSAKVEEVVSSSPIPLEKLFMTFTIKNGADLAERFEHLVSSMKKLLHKRRNSLAKKPLTNTVLKHISSAVYTYEVTYNEESGEFHPHIHMVALLPKGILQFSEKRELNKKTGEYEGYYSPVKFSLDLIEDWKKITEDSWNVDVRRIEDVKMEGQVVPANSLIKAIIETFKYAIKIDANETPIQIEMYLALKGRRLIGSFGDMRGVVIPIDLNDKPLDDSEIPYIDILYQYCGADIGYSVTDVGKFDISKDGEGMLEFTNMIARNKRHKVKNAYMKSVEKRERFDGAVSEFMDNKLTQHDECLELIHDYYESE